MNELVVGRTYFRLTFADRDFTMPGVEPLVYIGEVIEEGNRMLVVQDTVSYVRFGSRLELPSGEDHDIVVELIRPEDAAGSLLEVDAIARKVAEAAQRAATLGHPVLRVLRTGWTDGL
jgi:hypothetical protein